MKRMPEPIDRGRYFEGTIGAIMIQKAEFNPIFDNPRKNERVVMGRSVPSWQRPLVWTQAQKIKFIESAWMGNGLGTYTVNDLSQISEISHPLNNLLIDGQQRLSAIEDYLEDGFPVFGALWSELESQDRLRFKRTKFAAYETCSTDETFLRGYYDMMNFGGTAHTPDQTASFDATELADDVSRAIGSLSLERGPDGTVAYYDVRLAEPEVNSPGPEIALIPAEATSRQARDTLRRLRQNLVFQEMTQHPLLAAHVPELNDTMPAWIVNESGDDVLILAGRGDDDQHYVVDRDARIVQRREPDGEISGEFDLHDVPYSKQTSLEM